MSRELRYTVAFIVLLALSFALAGCTATVRREGEVLFMYCTVFCVLRIVDADATIETKLRKALPIAHGRDAP